MMARFMRTGTRKILRLKSAGLRSRWVMYMCLGSILERKGERFSGARLKGAGGSWFAKGEGFEVEEVDLKARAFAFDFGGILLSLG